MKIQPVVLTCPIRSDVLRKTLLGLKSLPAPPPGLIVNEPLVQMDTNTCERIQERQERNSLAALQAFLKTDADLMLFLEDDLEFNRHFWHNIAEWAPLKFAWFTFGSLYNPTVQEKVSCRPKYYFEADPNCVYGSQAYLLSRACVEFCVIHWAQVPGMQDIKISRLAASIEDGALYYFAPSIVQHVGDISTFGGGFHTAPSYNATFKIGSPEIYETMLEQNQIA